LRGGGGAGGGGGVGGGASRWRGVSVVPTAAVALVSVPVADICVGRSESGVVLGGPIGMSKTGYQVRPGSEPRARGRSGSRTEIRAQASSGSQGQPSGSGPGQGQVRPAQAARLRSGQARPVSGPGQARPGQRSGQGQARPGLRPGQVRPGQGQARPGPGPGQA
jgi:hypothetical protein